MVVGLYAIGEWGPLVEGDLGLECAWERGS